MTTKVKPAVSKAKAKKTSASKTNKITMTAVNTAIALMVASSQAFAVDATKASIIALSHCEQHGDATGLERLYNALGTTGQRVGPERQKALMRWLKEYSPARRNNKTTNFGLLKTTAPNYVPFNLDDAEATPFLDFISDAVKAPTMFSNEAIAKRITNLFTKDYADTWEGPALNRARIVEMVEANIAEANAA